MNYAFQYTVLRKPVETYQGCELTVLGYVSSDCTLTDGKAGFSFFAEEIQLQGKSENFSRTIRMDVYRVCETHDFSPGVRLAISGVLEKPSGARNPGGFNYESLLQARKTPARMAVKADAILFSGENKDLPLLRFGLGIRQVILEQLDINLSDEKAALMAAMLAGYKEDLTDSMENAFSITVLTNNKAVSGANLAFLLQPLLRHFRMQG